MAGVDANDEQPVLGVDGTRGGWVGVRLDPAGVDVLAAPTLTALVEAAEPVGVVAVDMPIALEAHDRRRADDEARRLLGPRRSSIFPAPALGVLDFTDDDYPGANAWSKATTGRGLSKQAWFLVPKIREVRALAAHRAGVHEVSPELSFAAMAGAPLPDAKTTWRGLLRRIELLAAHGVDLPVDPGPAGAAAPDDVVDAAACAWSARRVVLGDANCVPADGAAGPEARGGEAVITW